MLDGVCFEALPDSANLENHSVAEKKRQDIEKVFQSLPLCWFVEGLNGTPDKPSPGRFMVSTIFLAGVEN